MEHSSIEDPDSPHKSPVLVTPDAQKEAAAPANAQASVEPGVVAGTQDGLAEIADRDLAATLQLLVGRAQYLTGASAVSIALGQGGAMICRARFGEAAPQLGEQSRIDGGLLAESIARRQSLRCDRAETDSRVNQQSCRALGVVSVMLVPLIQEQQVTGMVELLSDRENAFEPRDEDAMGHLAELIQSAMQHAEAVRRGAREIAAPQPETAALAEDAPAGNPPGADLLPRLGDQPADHPGRQPETGRAAPISIRKCAKCEFPISEGRTLCVDCESAEEQNQDGSSRPSAVVLAQLREANEQSWWRRNAAILSVLLALGLFLLFLLWARRF
jgi:GAF domain